MRLDDLTKQTKSATVKYGDLEFGIKFYISYYTTEFEGKFQKLQESTDSVSEMAVMLASAVSSWEIEEPPTAENLAKLGIVGMGAVFTAIGEAMASPKAR